MPGKIGKHLRLFRVLIEVICSMKQSIVDDMDALKASPYRKKGLTVFGFLFDIIKGTVTDVEDL